MVGKFSQKKLLRFAVRLIWVIIFLPGFRKTNLAREKPRLGLKMNVPPRNTRKTGGQNPLFEAVSFREGKWLIH